MVQEAIEGIIIGISLLSFFSFCLALWYMIYVAFCQRCCRQHSWENRFEKTESRLYVMEVSPKMPESNQEHLRSSTVFCA